MGEEIIVVRSNAKEFIDIAREIIGSEMGWLHSYYALESVRSGLSKIAVAFMNGKPLGVGIYYIINGLFARVCVHYYIVVLKKYRGKGIGKIITLSIEELNDDVKGFISTTKNTNYDSRRLFRSLGYNEYTWKDIENKLGYNITRILMKATCGFEDDMIMVKSLNNKPLDLLLNLAKERKVIEYIWRNICWYPWIRLRNKSY